MAYKETSGFPPGCAVVFGGSGAVGAAMAKILSTRGVDVLLTYNTTPDTANRTASDIIAAGGRALSEHCDILDKQTVQDCINKAKQHFGCIHTVVLATGRVFWNLPMAEMDVDEFEAQMRTDTTGFFNVIKSTLPELRDNGGGSITVIMAVTLERIFANNGMAAIPKIAQTGMIKFLAQEEAGNQIRVNGIAPGVIEEGMSRKMMARNSIVTSNASEWTPLGREGSVNEIAEAGVFLASDKSGFTTGQILVIDGGLTL